MPYLTQHCLNGTAHAVFSTDALATMNTPDQIDLEYMIGMNVNTGRCGQGVDEE